MSVRPVISENVLAPHKVHVADPIACLYVPARQIVHGPPWGPEKPARHIQFDDCVLPAIEVVFPVHKAGVADRNKQNVLIGQLVQALALMLP